MIWDKLTTQGIKLASFLSASALCEQSGFIWQLQETSALLYSLLAANATVQIYWDYDMGKSKLASYTAHIFSVGIQPGNYICMGPYTV